MHLVANSRLVGKLGLAEFLPFFRLLRWFAITVIAPYLRPPAVRGSAVIQVRFAAADLSF